MVTTSINLPNSTTYNDPTIIFSSTDDSTRSLYYDISSTRYYPYIYSNYTVSIDSTSTNNYTYWTTNNNLNSIIITTSNYSRSMYSNYFDYETYLKEELQARKKTERLNKNAEMRANLLLESLLSEEELNQYSRNKSLLVKTDKYDYTLELGKKVVRYNRELNCNDILCVEPKTKLPKIDKLIAFKCLIETDEDYFNKTANLIKTEYL